MVWVHACEWQAWRQQQWRQQLRWWLCDHDEDEQMSFEQYQWVFAAMPGAA